MFSPEECAHIRGLAAPTLARSVVEGDQEIQDFRTSSTAFLYAEVDDLRSRLCALTGLTPEYAEPMQVQMYLPGQQYESHNDFFSELPDPDYGNRIATVVCYLNDVAEGGGTSFTHYGLTVTPKTGRAVYFEYGADYLKSARKMRRLPKTNRKLDPRCEHAGDPVISGEKWSITQWFNVPKALVEKG